MYTLLLVLFLVDEVANSSLIAEDNYQRNCIAPAYLYSYLSLDLSLFSCALTFFLNSSVNVVANLFLPDATIAVISATLLIIVWIAPTFSLFLLLIPKLYARAESAS